MSGCKHSIWKILIAGAAMFLMVPSLAWAEFGVCPPYSKTFGPDDPPEEILAFLNEINLRPGGGTLVLVPGDYFFPEESGFDITGVVCIRAESGDARVNAGVNVHFGATATLEGVAELWVEVAQGATVFVENSALSGWDRGLYVQGSAFLSDTKVAGISNDGTLVMTGGSFGHRGDISQCGTEWDPWCETEGVGLLNRGYALLDRVQVTGSSATFKDLWEEGQGIQNYSGGILILDGSTVAKNASGGPDGIGNEGYVEMTRSIVGGCDGVVDLGYNVAQPGCITEPTSLAAEAQFLPGSIELAPGSPGIDMIPVGICPSTDALGRVRTDGNGDGIVACDAGALEYGYGFVEARVRALPYYWWQIGEVDLSTSVRVDMYVFSTDTFDATSIVPDSITVEGFNDNARRSVYPIDPDRNGLTDIQVGYRLDRMAPIPCGYNERRFTAMSVDGREVAGQLKFDAVGCVP